MYIDRLTMNEIVQITAAMKSITIQNIHSLIMHSLFSPLFTFIKTSRSIKRQFWLRKNSNHTKAI